MKSVMGMSNDMDTYIGDMEKAGWKDESFQLDVNEILNADEKLKEAEIKLFLDNFEVLAPHPSQYGETKVLEIKIDLVCGRSHINLE